MKAAFVRVAELADQVRGVTYGKAEASATARPGYLPILRAGNITDEGLTFEDLVFVPAKRVAPKQLIRQNDVVIAASSGSIDVVGKAARALKGFDGGFGAFCKVLRPGSGIDPGYFAHFFKTQEYRRKVSALAAGININNLRNEHLDDMTLLVPPVSEQTRLAGLLDRAEALRDKRRVALATLDRLTHAIFVDMFGDPAANPKGWPCETLGSLASKFSDGPFGSNLKTEHYTLFGVRIVRLQNIGVGAFRDEDSAFVSETHFSRLIRHECLPGDVLVATMGDPNVRACVQPDWLPRALNKADCVQVRPDQRVANAAYLCALLNQPSTERMAQELMHGQTRIRISMGQLRQLKVPVPPLALQRAFASRLAAVEALRRAQLRACDGVDRLFRSVQQRAFSGEL